MCVPNETKDLKVNSFNVNTEENESKFLLKDIPCKRKYKFDTRKCNSNQKWSNNKYWYECKKHHKCEKDYIWNPATCSCKNWKYLPSIIVDSVSTCDEVTEKTKYF